MTERGRRHFGSIRKLPSGRWQASYWHEGSRHVAASPFPAKAYALAWISTVESDILRGTWVDRTAGKMLFGELAGRWLESNPAKRQSTFERDEAIIRLHLLATLGQVQIASITRMKVQELVNTWVASSCAPRTVRRQYDVLRAIFAFADDNDELVRTPCRQIKLPAAGKGRGRALTTVDVARIAEATPVLYRPMVWIGAVLGLRWGEVAGLQWSSI
jgi:integrase